VSLNVAQPVPQIADRTQVGCEGSNLLASATLKDQEPRELGYAHPFSKGGQGLLGSIDLQKGDIRVAGGNLLELGPHRTARVATWREKVDQDNTSGVARHYSFLEMRRGGSHNHVSAGLVLVPGINYLEFAPHFFLHNLPPENRNTA